MGLSTEDLDQIAAMIRNSRNSDRPLKADVDSASDDFSNILFKDFYLWR